MDDMESLLLTFPEVCKKHLSEYPTGRIIPSRFNSDVIENHFCQVRGLHNGNQTHPNYASYCHTVNGIVLGQSLKSVGRKSNAGILTASPYLLHSKEPPVKKLKDQ
jgi:hypothetical protein